MAGNTAIHPRRVKPFFFLDDEQKTFKCAEVDQKSGLVLMNPSPTFTLNEES